MRLLHIDSSILGEESVSRRLSEAVVAGYRAASPGIQIDRLDLVAQPLPHFTAADLAARGMAGGSAGAGDMTSDPLEPFLAADVVVLGAPMYNFTIPSQLKAWIDRILVANRTFAYTPEGPRGLVGDKSVVVAAASGGHYGAESPSAAAEHVRSYLTAIFGFIGVTDLRFVVAEGLQAGVEDRGDIVDAAPSEARRMAA